jgi:hypothetical protein
MAGYRLPTTVARPRAGDVPMLGDRVRRAIDSNARPAHRWRAVYVIGQVAARACGLSTATNVLKI